MSEFINTADIIGDDELCDQIIMRTVTNYRENRITRLGDYAFCGCDTLTEVNVPNVTTAGEYAFYRCNALTEVNMPNLKSTGLYCFGECASLSKVICKSLTTIGHSSFRSSINLKIIDVFSAGNDNNWDWARDCSSLQAIVLRSPSVCQLIGVNAIANTPIASGTGYIYVPSALIEDYKVATNWSTYAAQFRALEDYTVDGTITGELDETKI